MKKLMIVVLAMILMTGFVGCSVEEKVDLDISNIITQFKEMYEKGHKEQTTDLEKSTKCNQEQIKELDKLLAEEFPEIPREKIEEQVYLALGGLELVKQAELSRDFDQSWSAPPPLPSSPTGPSGSPY